MNTITIRTITEDSFTRINNDINGNPRHVLHYMKVCSDYSEALNICKNVGGKKYHNRSFGGGIVFSDYSLQSLTADIQKAVIANSNPYIKYLLNNVVTDDYDAIIPCQYSSFNHVKVLVQFIQDKFKAEKGINYGYSVDTCEDYLRGLGGFNHEYSAPEIVALGYKFKDLRKNASSDTIDNYAEVVYWRKLAEALHVILNVSFEG